MNQGGCYKALTPSKKYVNCLVNAQPNNSNIHSCPLFFNIMDVVTTHSLLLSLLHSDPCHY